MGLYTTMAMVTIYKALLWYNKVCIIKSFFNQFLLNTYSDDPQWRMITHSDTAGDSEHTSPNCREHAIYNGSANQSFPLQLTRQGCIGI